MLDTMEVIQETINGLTIGTMTIDLGLPGTVLVQGHQNYTSNISKKVADTMLGSTEVE